MRLELTGLPSYLQPGSYGTDSETSVAFVSGDSTGVDFGVNNPADYCQSNPYVATTCYTAGDPLDPSNVGEPALAAVLYNDSGSNPASKYAVNAIDNVGSTWGLALDRNNQDLYIAAVLKRHNGLGSGGIGAIYIQDDYTDPSSSTLFYDFGALAGTVSSNSARFPGTGDELGEEGPCRECDNVDPTTFAQAGKTGLGDIDISDDNSTLYVTNLFDRKLYSIDITGVPTHTEVAGAPWLDNSICNANGDLSASGVARPWATKFHDGQIYVGAVCDASTSDVASCNANTAGGCEDLTAHIFAYDGSSWSTVLPTPVVLDYERTFYKSIAASYWHPWTDNYADIKSYVDYENDSSGSHVDVQYPVPILVDIEFTYDDSIILGLGDRSSFQFGYEAPAPDDVASAIGELYFSAGDILRVGYNAAGTTYELENNGRVYDASGTYLNNVTSNSPAGPGGEEFYDDSWDVDAGAGQVTDSGIGSLAVRPGSGEVIFSISDLLEYYGAGIGKLSNIDGDLTQANSIQIYADRFW